MHNSCQFPREIFILYQQNSRKPVFLYIFQGLVQIEAIPHPIASIWLDCFEVETLEKHPNCKTLSRLGLVCLCPKWKTWSCSTCLAMLHTAQFREGSYSFVVKHWVKRSKRVENAGFFFTFWHKSAQFLSISQRNYHTLSAKLKNPLFLHIFQGLVQIEAIPHPIASIWLDCFEVETLEKHPLQNTVSFGSRLSLPKMENTGRAQPALQCCTLHSLERDHTHLWSNIESKVQNELKMNGFLHILAQQCTILVNFPEKLSYFISKTQKTRCFCIFSRGSFK